MPGPAGRGPAAVHGSGQARVLYHHPAAEQAEAEAAGSLYAEVGRGKALAVYLAGERVWWCVSAAMVMSAEACGWRLGGWAVCFAGERGECYVGTNGWD